ncbi:MAG: ATP-binding cassette domain-containing protein [Candidatus Omnitrophica bacterium]|nr:ATP-binding cassette domain-containing protein [Candidatus Omnitrophota bacterium]
MISLKNLRVGFDGKEVLKGISLDVKRGESLVIVGSSGCGKSVLLKTILGLIKPDEGDIYVFGERITVLPEKKLMEVRGKIGMVFQSSALFDSLSVWENVGFYHINHTGLTDEQIKTLGGEILKDVGMGDFADFLPEQLSGGMKKRVSVARALASKPEILFYDEPTTGLDPVTSESITKLIIEMHGKFKTTDITVTHDIKLASRISDRIALIENGAIEEIGPFEELREKSKNPIIRSFTENGG